MKSLFCYSLVFCLLFSCKEDSSIEKRTATNDLSNWMQQLINKYPEQTISLNDIAIPGAHDAGVYVLTNCTFGANSCNTQTQEKNFLAQLEQGVRFFDVRPTLVGNEYLTFHATDCDGLGCKGGYMKDILTDVNTFLSSHAELVILELSHFCRTDYSDSVFLQLLNNKLGDKIYKETTYIETPFIDRSLTSIINSNTQGKVLLIFEGAPDNILLKQQGIFSNSILPREGSWTNSQTLTDLKAKQLEEYEDFSNRGNTLFQFSWQITLDANRSIACALNPKATSIRSAANTANAAFKAYVDELIANRLIMKGRIPNVIYHDFCTEEITSVCIAISEINLK